MVFAAGFEHEQNALDDFLFSDTRHYGTANKPASLISGATVEFDEFGTTSSAPAESEEVRFQKMVDHYKKGGPDESDFAIPTYQRNQIPLYDLSRIPQDEWIETPLYED